MRWLEYAVILLLLALVLWSALTSTPADPIPPTGLTPIRTP